MSKQSTRPRTTGATFTENHQLRHGARPQNPLLVTYLRLRLNNLTPLTQEPALDQEHLIDTNGQGVPHLKSGSNGHVTHRIGNIASRLVKNRRGDTTV